MKLTYDEVSDILNVFKKYVKIGKYTISRNHNRKENISFIREYNISEEAQKEILLKLNVEDFCYAARNSKHKYKHEILYIFAPNVTLYDVLDEEIVVAMYIKFNLLNTGDKESAIVISFHKLNKPVKYAFK